MRFALFILMIFSVARALAQTDPSNLTIFDKQSQQLPTDTTYYTLPAYEYWDRQPWKDSVYQFPEFQEGKLEFASGFSPSTRLSVNYNIFLETIDVVGDEVAPLKKFPELKFIWIGEHKFMYSPSLGYLEIIQQGKISVARKTAMVCLVELSDGFKYRIIPAVDAKTSSDKLIRHYWPTEQYFILDPGHRPYRAGPLVLPALVPDLKNRIRDFATINHINYEKKQDILRVVAFCNENYIEPSKKANAPVYLTIPASLDLKHSVWKDSIYRFREFEETTLVYTDGSKEQMTVNYNLETGWFDTIGKKGDTVAVNTTGQLLVTNIDGVTLRYNRAQGLLEVLMQGKVGLGVKKRIALEGEYNAMLDSMTPDYRVPREKVYRLERTYFLLKGDRALFTNVKSLMSLFPKHREEIDKYINANSPDLSSKKDLVMLLNYCSGL